jgi:hypothetical protein
MMILMLLELSRFHCHWSSFVARIEIQMTISFFKIHFEWLLLPRVIFSFPRVGKTPADVGSFASCHCSQYSNLCGHC